MVLCTLLLLAPGCSRDDPDVAEVPRLSCQRVRPLNGKPLSEDAARRFSFLVGGHLYGSPTRTTTGPSKTFLDAIPLLLESKDDFFVSLGDFVKSHALDDILRSLGALALLPMPVLNAPGNHDLADRPGYLRCLGPTFGAQVHGSALLVFLDTEALPWNIPEDQLRLLDQALAAASASPRIRQIFVFAHKLVFAAGDDRYASVFTRINARDGWEGRSNFRERVLPLLLRDGLPKRHTIAWFGGDVGLDHSLPSTTRTRARGSRSSPPESATFLATDSSGSPSSTARSPTRRSRLPADLPPISGPSARHAGVRPGAESAAPMTGSLSSRLEPDHRYFA